MFAKITLNPLNVYKFLQKLVRSLPLSHVIQLQKLVRYHSVM